MRRRGRDLFDLGGKDEHEKGDGEEEDNEQFESAEDFIDEFSESGEKRHRLTR